MATVGRAGRAAGVFILLAGLNRAVSMLILPFISRVVSPSEFGAATTVSATSLFLVSLFAMPLDTLVVYAAPRAGGESRALLRVAGLYCYFALPAISLLPAAMFAFFAPELLGISGTIWAIEIVAIGLMPAMMVYALPMVKSSQKLRKFVWLASTSIATLAVSKMILVVGLRLGVLGWVVSDLISAAISAITAAILVRPPPVRISWEDVRKVAAFAIPIIPHTVALWGIGALSRPALAMVSDLKQVGFLSAGLTVASAVIIVIGEINRAVQPGFSQETFPAPTDKTFTPVRWLIVSATAVPAAAGCGLALFGSRIFAEPYWPAFRISGVLLIGLAIYGFYPIAINYLVLTAGITKFSSIATGTGAAVVAAFVFAFGGRYGAVGVSYGVGGGYFAMAAVALMLTKFAKLDIDWSQWRLCWPEMLSSATALTLSVVALGQPVNSADSRLSAAGSLMLLAGTGLLLIVRPVHVRNAVEPQP